MKTKLIGSNFFWTACLGVCLPFAVVHAGPQYTVSDLGSLGGAYGIGLGVNNSGLVSGFSHLVGNSAEHASVGQSLTLPQDFGTFGGTYSQAYGINNLGLVVGSAELLGDASYHAFQWAGGVTPPLGKLTDLKALVASGYSRAFSLNDKGQATGFSSTALAGIEHAVLWQSSGLITDLGTLDGTGNSQGVAINVTGQVAGFSSLTGNKATHAVLWANGIKKDLGTLGGTHSAAYGINAQGDVTGSATTALEAAQHAFLWQSTAVPPMQDLGTLGGTFSEAYGISSVGEVIGSATTLNNADRKAFLWQSGLGLQDLNTLMEPVTGAGWTLLDAQAISDDGRYITGVGILTTVDVVTGAVLGKGDRHAFLLKKLITDTTPPVISYSVTPAAPGVTGWYVSAPAVVWTVTDPESAISSKVGCVDSPLVSNTAPAGQAFSCAATSAGGTATPVSTLVLKVDNLPPVFAGVPAAITQAATGFTGAVVTYTAPTAADTFSGVSPAGVSCTPVSGSTFAIGSTPVNCSVSDIAGNTNSVGFVVSVADQTPPVITSNVTGTAGLNGWFTSPVSVAWNVIDNQSALTSTLGCTLASIATNGINQIRTCAASSAGGTATVNTPSINIDTQAPVFASCPATVALTQGQALSQPTVTDNLSSPVVTGAPASLPVGITTVTWKATDQAGLSSNCVQQVSVAAAITETIAVTKAQCKKISATSGQWLVQGTSTNSTGNSIQLFSTPTVPVNLGSSILGAAVPVVKGAWVFQPNPGPACTTPISLRSSAAGKVMTNIGVTVQ
jgi:probable HAF family extracellular repeat protein